MKEEKGEKKRMLTFPFKWEDAEEAKSLSDFLKNTVPYFEVAKHQYDADDDGFVTPENTIISSDDLAKLQSIFLNNSLKDVLDNSKDEMDRIIHFCMEAFECGDKEHLKAAARELADFIKDICERCMIKGLTLGTECVSLIPAAEDNESFKTLRDDVESLKKDDGVIFVSIDTKYKYNEKKRGEEQINRIKRFNSAAKLFDILSEM